MEKVLVMSLHTIYTLDDDSEHPMDYETSLLPKVFPLSCLLSSILNWSD